MRNLIDAKIVRCKQSRKAVDCLTQFVFGIPLYQEQLLHSVTVYSCVNNICNAEEKVGMKAENSWRWAHLRQEEASARAFL
uniref:Uncharacterized protein n=1 Tax=Romanomermis culicivorax TaxID=13658 RepID=A0A915L7U1_ROMCU